MKFPANLFDKEYRDEFVSANVETGLAFQLRSLREREKLTQAELAGAMGTRQSVIARLEDPSYGKFTIKTLEKIANFFDVALLVRFVPFRELFRYIDHSSPEELAILSFKDEVAAAKPPVDDKEQKPVASGPTIQQRVSNDVNNSNKAIETAIPINFRIRTKSVKSVTDELEIKPHETNFGRTSAGNMAFQLGGPKPYGEGHW